MEKINELTNAELREYMDTLNNEYEVVKKEIMERVNRLDELDLEWNKCQNEINKRKSTR